MSTYTAEILLGIASGFLARLYMLRTDYRNYPSYPHGYIIHLSLGAIAAALAAIAVPALLEEEYTAITFLVLCAQQFRDIRNMERETLMKLDETALVPRGADYIEGIAKVFESRNYLVMLVSLTVTICTIFIGWTAGLIAAVVMILVCKAMMRGSFIQHIASVDAARLHFEGALLLVDDIVIMNVGDPAARKKILAEGVGIVLHPKDDNARAILNNVGQRQAILHNLAVLVGSKVEVGEPEWTPLARKNIDTGVLGVFILPNEKDLDCIIDAAYKTPVLESAVQKPLASQIGRRAAD